MTDNTERMNTEDRIRYVSTNKAKIMFFITVMILFLLRFRRTSARSVLLLKNYAIIENHSQKQDSVAENRSRIMHIIMN